MSSIGKGINKVNPVVPVEKSKATDNPPKQQPYVAKEKKKKDPDAIVDLTAEGQIYSTGGGAGQSYRKYKAKPAGVAEEQAPMFTPEDSVANLNDPRSDGWRVYKSKPAGLNEENVAVVKNALVDRVRKYKMNLVSKYGVRPVMAAIQDTAIKHSNTPEKSLSDISIWVKEIENMLDRGKYSDLKETSIGEACWKTHKQVGMKKKGGKMVPNCVPKESIEEVSDFKKKEIEWELRHEKNNYLVAIDGKGWKVFADKAHAEAVARKLRNKGKNATVHPTGAPASESINENDQHLDEDLRKWFKEKWVRFGPDGKIRGACARGDDSEGKPKCLPQSKAHSLGKKGRASAAARKRREDPNPERRGKAKNVATKKKTNESNDPGYTKALADLQYLVSFIKSNPKMMGKEIKQMGPINPAQNIIKKALKGCDYIEQLLKAQNNVAVSSAMSNLKKELMNWFNDGNKPLSDLLQGTIGKIKFPTNEEKCPHCGGELVSEELMNEKKDACYHKVKARYKVWPSAYASGALVKCRKKGASNWGKSKQKESAVIKGMAEALKDPESDRTIKNIIGQNPKGSAAEKIVLNRFISTRMADDLQGEDWIEQCAVWLETNKQKLQKEFPELDLSNVNALAEKMYEDFLAASGQLEEDYKKDFDDEIERMIKNIWDVEKEKISSKEPRYLVYSQNTGLELETDSLDDAVFSAKILSKRNLDSPSLVYDRKTKFPVVSYQGSEDMWYKTNSNSPRLHEANPKQQISLYNPSGTTYRQQPMPTLQKDPVDKARQLSKNIPADLSDPDEEIRQQQLKKKLDALLTSELTPREKKVLTSYYYDGKTFEKIAQEIGFSTARARQIVMKAERKLRHPERAKHLKPFLVNEADALDFAVPLNKAKASSFIDTGEIDKEKEVQNLYKIIEMLPPLQKKIIQLYADGNNVQEISKKLHMTPGSANYHLNQAYKFIRNYGYYDDKSGVTDLGHTQLRDEASSKYFAHAYNKAKRAGGKVIFDPATKLFYAVSKNVPGIEYIANKEYSALQTQLKSAEQTLQQFQPKGSSIYDYWPKTDAHKAAYRNWRNIKNKMRVTAQGIPKINKNVTEYGEVPGQRKVEFSKKNPPPFDHVYQQFIQTMLLPDNTIEPKVWIDNVNKLYGLNYTYRDFQNRGHKDYTNNWDKIVKRYILGKTISEEQGKVQEYTTKDLDLVIMFLSKQMGMSVGEVVRQYVKPMIEKGEIKVIDDEPLIR